MQRKEIYVTILCLAGLAISLVITGCGGKEKYGKYTEEQMQQFELAHQQDLPVPSGDTMVLGIGPETISSDEILAVSEESLAPGARQMNEAAFSNWARPYIQEVIRSKITDILLYQQARKTAPDTIDEMLEKAVDREVARFVASYGNNYALAESKIKEMGMDWQSFKEYQKKLIMTQSYLSTKLKNEKRFSQQQLRDYYDRNKDELFCQKGEVGFSVIEIQPDRLTAEQIADDSDTLAAAKRIAAGLIKDLENGADFAELAKQYHGSMAEFGGRFSPFEPGKCGLRKPYNSLEAPSLQMKVGQVKGPIEIDGRVFVLKLDTLQIGSYDAFEDVQQHIQQQLLFQYKQQQYKELFDEIAMNTDLAEFERFAEFCLRQAYRRWSQ